MDLDFWEPDLDEVTEVTNYLIGIAQDIKKYDPQKTGVTLTFGLENMMRFLPIDVGIIPEEKKIKYSCVSQEKLHRVYGEYLLAKAFEEDLEGRIFSSFQTKNKDENKWGGAVLFSVGKVIYGISISGLCEFGDEASALCLGKYYGLNRDNSFYKKVIKVSQNDIFEPMLNRLKSKNTWNESLNS